MALCSNATIAAAYCCNSSSRCKIEQNALCSKISSLSCFASSRSWNGVAVHSLSHEVGTGNWSSLRVVAAAARRRRRASFDLGVDDEDDDNWDSDMFGEFDETGEEDDGVGQRIRRKGSDSIVLKEEETADDWAGRARQRAISVIQERGLPVTALLEERRKKKKKSRKKKQQNEDGKTGKLLKSQTNDPSPANPAKFVEPPMDNPLMSGLGSGEGFRGLAEYGNYWKGLGQTPEIRINENARPKEVQFLIEEDSQLMRPGMKSPVSQGPHRVSSRQRRQDDLDVNRSLVEARSANEVLTVVSNILESSSWTQGESSLSPTNISTALHRIAKHMESESMPKSDRLAVARQRTMALLVSAAVESLPHCSAQSISNISWALSKVGGSSMYWMEMDLLGQAAMSNVSDLQPQHLANIAGAFASMQHSVPNLFQLLVQRASSLHRTFQTQELTQLLWAFASLNEPASLLLDSLDSDCECKAPSASSSLSNGGTSARGTYFDRFTLSELCSLSWSYTVLNELRRPSFHVIWEEIVKRSKGSSAEVPELAGKSVQLSQLHQTSQSLELEYLELNLERLDESLGTLARSEWEKQKGGKMSTSTTQKDVEMLLISTGLPWICEYSAASHSLDLALVEKRIAIEIDGPTHFARNTGTALGHTVLKRRQLSAAGWAVLSVPYLEWDELFGEEEQMEYLRSLLRNYL
ncbi:hypothetical protein R1sor_012756 [Riccia sorocarpa]|uniref:RAP domain-containing protein n=1 Tax=Riccia sorocarpa TaxID=122646 RepID=A0ABD3I897_9MARC